MYHPATVLATTWRIILQVVHDKRTIALMLVAPILLMSLLYWMFLDSPAVFDMIAPALLGVFPFVIMFLITSITTLRERTSGTMERLMTTPVGRFDIIMGYAFAFTIFGVVQSMVASAFAIHMLGMSVPGSQVFVVFVAALNTVLGVALGLLVSAFARTEFQAMQFMPLFVFPQILVCGLFMPLSALPGVLEAAAYGLPLTYAVDALTLATQHADITAEMWRDSWVVTVFIAVALGLASLTLRRQTN